MNRVENDAKYLFEQLAHADGETRPKQLDVNHP
jgi:hypothetical protein